jgi:hypothetical protein
MTQTRFFRIFAGIVCLILAFAAGAIGLMMGFLGTRREADTGSPAAFAVALLLLFAGLGLLTVKRR